MPDQSIETALQLHRSGRLAEAEKIYRQVLAENPNHPDALNLLGLVAYTSGHKETARDLILRATQISPATAEFHSNLSAVFESLEQADNAIAAARRSISIRPDSPTAWYNLANALRRQGDLEAAVDAYRRSLQIDPNQVEVRGNLATTLRNLGRLAEAIAEFEAAVAQAPNVAYVHSNLGDALRDAGQIERSISVLRQAIALDPNHALAFNNLGTSLQKAGQSEEALACFRRAAELDPSLPEAHNNLANVHHAARRYDQAIVEHAITVKLRPTFAEAWSNYGNTLKEKGLLEQSAAACRRAIQLRPNYPEAYYNLGNALKELHQQDEAIAAYDRALELDPDHPRSANNKASILKEQGLAEEAIRCYDRYIDFDPDTPGVHSNRLYVRQFIPGIEPAELFRLHRDWAQLHEGTETSSKEPHHNDRSPDRRLRIGYVSPDLHLHSVAFFLLPLLESHDKGQVYVTCYYSQDLQDQITARLRAAADAWRDISAVDPDETAELIRADQIDVLVDLAGHTAHNSLVVFARKPAPVQVTYLGYPATTGLQAMDWRIADQFTDPPGAEAFYTEKIFRLPRTAWCFEPLSGSPPIEPAAHSQIVFGSFNDLAKVNLPLMRLWSRILHSVPNSRLYLKNRATGSQSVVRRLIDQFGNLGIPSDRLDLIPPCLGTEDHMRRYNQIDIALDTWPYHGTTTTCEALWMGIPVVTQAGQFHVSRVGVSLLSSVGLTDCIAADEDDYLRIAVELAENKSRRDELRATLRDRMRNSPLMNAPDLARHIEAAYRAMWRQWVEAP